MLKKILLVLVFLSLSINVFLNSERDWDLPGYVGAIIKIDNDSPKEIHTKAYFELKNDLSKKEFLNITGNKKGYRYEQFLDYRNFYSQLQYYDTKLLYVSLGYLIHNLGFSVIHSILLVSSISYFFIGLVVFSLLKNFVTTNFFLCFLGSIVLLFFPWIRELSMIASPDALSLLFLLCFFYYLCKEESLIFLSTYLLILILIRPDNIIFALFFLVFNTLIKKVEILKTIIIFFSLVFIQYLNMKINNYFGWHSLFYDTFIYRRSIAKPINFGFIAYKDVVCHNILNLKKVLVLTFLILIITINRKKKITKSQFIFSLIIFFTILSKIFLFPISQTRFYIPFLLVGYFNLIINKSKKLKT